MINYYLTRQHLSVGNLMVIFDLIVIVLHTHSFGVVLHGFDLCVRLYRASKPNSLLEVFDSFLPFCSDLGFPLKMPDDCPLVLWEIALHNYLQAFICLESLNSKLSPLLPLSHFAGLSGLGPLQVLLRSIPFPESDLLTEEGRMAR